VICPRCGGPLPGEPDDGIEADWWCAECEDEALGRDRDAVDHGDSRCIGAECVNPHPFHTYSECETVEMHEAYEQSLDDSER